MYVSQRDEWFWRNLIGFGHGMNGDILKFRHLQHHEQIVKSYTFPIRNNIDGED